MFPNLFPTASGMHDGSLRLMYYYCLMRVLALFSAFTLHVVYVIVMYIVLCASKVASSIPMDVLESDIRKFRWRHPGCNDRDLYNHLVKYSVPGTILGSPSWHRRKLSDLFYHRREHRAPGSLRDVDGGGGQYYPMAGFR